LFILCYIYHSDFQSQYILHYHGCGLCFAVAIFSPLLSTSCWFMWIPTYYQLDTSLDTPLDTPLYVDMWICEYVAYVDSLRHVNLLELTNTLNFLSVVTVLQKYLSLFLGWLFYTTRGCGLCFGVAIFSPLLSTSCWFMWISTYY
jgi:hypothetical protein